MRPAKPRIDHANKSASDAFKALMSQPATPSARTEQASSTFDTCARNESEAAAQPPLHVVQPSRASSCKHAARAWSEQALLLVRVEREHLSRGSIVRVRRAQSERRRLECVRARASSTASRRLEHARVPMALAHVKRVLVV
eukprot:6199776-Pleurochrysis_carterae.AAC.4